MKMKMMMRIPNNSVLVVAVALFAAAAGSMGGMAIAATTTEQPPISKKVMKSSKKNPSAPMLVTPTFKPAGEGTWDNDFPVANNTNGLGGSGWDGGTCCEGEYRDLAQNNVLDYYLGPCGLQHNDCTPCSNPFIGTWTICKKGDYCKKADPLNKCVPKPHAGWP